MMAAIRTLWARVAGVRRRSRDERELAEELESVLQMHMDENARAGMSPSEARRHAAIALHAETVQEACRDERRLPLVETVWHDLRYACRALRRTPAFAATALATLALGIGSTTAIFTVVNAVLLRPPPYPEPNRIMALGYPDGGAQDGELFHYIRERAGAFEHIAAHGGGTGWNLVVGERAEYVTGLPVSADFFDVLGSAPRLGRSFLPSEDRQNGPTAVVLSEPLWRRVFGGRADAIGTVVTLGGIPHEVVGVMPEGFATIPAADLWTPLRVSPTGSSWNYAVLGRLRPDATAAQAASDLERLKPRIRKDVASVPERRARALVWMPYREWLGLGSRMPLLLLLGAVGLLLLIACLNIAALHLVRALSRGREMATRAAIGGGRGRLVQQVLTEAVVLALGGAALGVLLAHWGAQGLVALVPGGLLEGRTVSIDGRVLAFALVLGMGSGLLFGLAPALGTARLDLRASLWGGSRTTAQRPVTWLRRTFVALELSMAVVLLVGAGLLIRTFVNLRSADLGFDPSGVAIAEMSLQGTTEQTREDMSAFFERALTRLRELPGVNAAAVANNVPVERGLNLALQPPAGSRVTQIRAVDWRYVTAEYFGLFQIPLRAGRLFDARDRRGGAPVVIVNEAFARTYFGSAFVVGRSIQVAGYEDPPREIIAVVGDVKARSGSGWTRGFTALGSAAAPMMYVPVSQVAPEILEAVHHFFPVKWIIRGRESDLEPAIQRVMRSANPRLPVIRVRTMATVVAGDLEIQRFLMTLLAAFAAVSLMLASVGMYGLVAYGVAQRHREVAVRVALGATPGRVLQAFLLEGLSLGAVAVVAGLAAAALLGRLLASMVFGISPLDPATFAAIGVLLLMVTGVATLLPALQALRTDPLRALRLD